MILDSVDCLQYYSDDKLVRSFLQALEMAAEKSWANIFIVASNIDGKYFASEFARKYDPKVGETATRVIRASDIGVNFDLSAEKQKEYVKKYLKVDDKVAQKIVENHVNQSIRFLTKNINKNGKKWAKEARHQLLQANQQIVH